MNYIRNKKVGGERPFFQIDNTEFYNCTITEGESALKHCSDIECNNMEFYGKYVLCYSDNFLVQDSFFDVQSKASIWYSNNFTINRTRIDASKLFRNCNNICLNEVIMNEADETFWYCNHIELTDVSMYNGSYPFMQSTDIGIDGLSIDYCDYAFQYVKDTVIRNATIISKDAFWETENVTIINSHLEGEYLGWHSNNLKLVNCHISGEQPLCYANNVTLINCTFDENCERAFEYSTIYGDIASPLKSIVNPISGFLNIKNVDEVVIDEYAKGSQDCYINIV